jgi:hypothetical protein
MVERDDTTHWTDGFARYRTPISLPHPQLSTQ